MRIYSSVLEAVKEIERDIFEMGIDSHAPTVQDVDVRENSDYDSKELPGYAYMITKFDDLDDIFDFFFQGVELQSVRDYCNQELQDRVCLVPLNPGTSWKFRRDYWERFLKSGKFSYTYSERMCDQVFRIIRELREAPESRQCVITIFDSCKDLKNLRGVARVPCSIYYQFLRRIIGGKDSLMLIYTMRSCDFYTHFPVDIWLAISLGKMVAGAVGSKLTTFTHFIGSLHIFRKDYEKRRIF